MKLSTTTRSPHQGHTHPTRGSSRGAVMVEYAFLLVAVAVPAIIGISLGGVGMLQKYERTRTTILNNSP
jgi:Flp pilus assembly pilin Flp